MTTRRTLKRSKTAAGSALTTEEAPQLRAAWAEAMKQSQSFLVPQPVFDGFKTGFALKKKVAYFEPLMRKLRQRPADNVAGRDLREAFERMQVEAAIVSALEAHYGELASLDHLPGTPQRASQMERLQNALYQLLREADRNRLPTRDYPVVQEGITYSWFRAILKDLHKIPSACGDVPPEIPQKEKTATSTIEHRDGRNEEDGTSDQAVRLRSLSIANCNSKDGGIVIIIIQFQFLRMA